MIRICRAEDGEVFQTTATARDIVSLGSFETFIRRETGIGEGASQAYLSDGRRLETENVRELDGLQDQIIFVFNNYYVHKDIDEAMKLLYQQPTLHLPIQGMVSMLHVEDAHNIQEESTVMIPSLGPSALSASYRRVHFKHQEMISSILDSMRYQQSALRVAFTAFDRRVLDVTNLFDDVAASARQVLDKQASLIASVDANKEIASRIQIHRDFLTPAALRAIRAGGPARTLYYYVSGERMHQVVDACQRTHDDLKERLSSVDEAMKRFADGAADMRLAHSDTMLLDQAERLDQVSRGLHDNVPETARDIGGPVPRVETLLQELCQSDTSIRENLASIAGLKNSSTERSLRAYSQITTLNDDLVALTADLTDLRADLGVETSLSELKRLHSVVDAYGTTIVEIVRRKEFSRLIYSKCHGVSETMNSFLAAERQRRQAFHGEVHGQLPFDLIGMHDTVPSINISLSGGGDTDSPYTLERSDIKDLLGVLEIPEWWAQPQNEDDMGLAYIRDLRAKLERLVSEIDDLESGFDRRAELSLLSSSRLSLLARHAEQGPKELVNYSLGAEGEEANRDSPLEEECRALKAEVAHLKEQIRNARDEHERAERLEGELNQAYAQIGSDAAARRTLEDRHNNLLSTVQGLREELDGAIPGSIGGARSPGNSRQEAVRTDDRGNTAEEVLIDQGEILRNSEGAHALDVDSPNRTNFRGKRKYVPGDGQKKGRGRAAMEHAESQTQTGADSRIRQRKQLKVTWAGNVRKPGDARGLENIPRKDASEGHAPQPKFEDKVEEATRIIAQLLEIADAFRTTSFKAMNLAQDVSHPPKNKRRNEFHAPAAATGALDEQPVPFIDPTDPASAIDILRAFDHDNLLEAIKGTGSTVRKWQKQCKEYRDRAKGKISFRNFSEGDLALFLPIRNTTSKPWAAFNVSSPHHFLKARGHQAEILRTREWIVGRITSIIERVVEPNVPDSNPYGLGDGVKYFLLEIEDWDKPHRTTHPANAPSTPAETSDNHAE